MKNTTPLGVKTSMKMKTLASLLAVSLLSLAVARAADTAVISGKVTLKGTPPPEVPIAQINGNPDCKANHPQIPNTKRYVVGANGELANCFVYVKDGLGERVFPPAAKAVVLDQSKCFYVPYVVGVQVGQDFEIRNSDSFMHNVHILAQVNKEENIAQPVKGSKNVKQFTKPEIMIKFMCNVHPWMFAYIGVVSHPFFAVTDEKGEFKLSGLPAGDYTIEVWHAKAGTQTVKVKVADGGTGKADFTLNVPEEKK